MAGPTALERALLRIETQIRLIDWAAGLLTGKANARPGVIIELGLGNGRTYDHLRRRLPDRRILVLDREMRANPHRQPPEHDFTAGEIEQTWRRVADACPHGAALIHADLGDGTDSYDAVLEGWLGEACAALAAPGAIILSSTPIEHAGIAPAAPPFTPLGGHYLVFERNRT